MSRKRVSYYYDPDIGAYSFGPGHPMRPLRMRITHELLTAYNLLENMDVLRPDRASAEAMTAFHTDEYVDFLSRVTPETADDLTFKGSRFLVGEDNPAFEGIFEFCSISAGGSIAAAHRITSGAADIAINWAGGLHHAKKREASGFCYINDIVLGIVELLRTYPRVLYIDIDCHHGDGVEEAFYTSERVMTCSFHKFGEYFPGTGTQKDRGAGKGFGYAVNIPLRDGLTDATLQEVFEPVVSKIIEVFQPSAIVLQCGADSLSGDKLGCFNLSMHGHAHCVQFVRSFDIPFILLGGGGYTVKNSARTWTYETACALGVEKDIDPKMPWNEFFEWFGPRYRLEVAEGNMEDMNLRENSLQKIKTTALQQLSELQPAPSVSLQDTPRESLGEHLGLGSREESANKLDETLAQTSRLVYSLQEPDIAEAASDTESESNYDSGDEDTRRRRSRRFTERWRKRMSIVSNDWFELPSLDRFGCGHSHSTDIIGISRKHKMFCSGLAWSLNDQAIVVQKEFTLTGGENVRKNGGSRAEGGLRRPLGTADRGVGNGGALGLQLGRNGGENKMNMDEEEE